MFPKDVVFSSVITVEVNYERDTQKFAGVQCLHSSWSIFGQDGLSPMMLEAPDVSSRGLGVQAISR
jgi:hypothetical protein